MRMPGSSWKDGTITEVVVRKSVTMGLALRDSTTRYSHRPHTMVPATASGKYAFHSPSVSQRSLINAVTDMGAPPQQRRGDVIPAEGHAPRESPLMEG